MSAVYLVLEDIGCCKPAVHIYRAQFPQIQQHRYLCVFGKQRAGFSLGRTECSSCPWEMGVDRVLSRWCRICWQLPWGESRATSHSCTAEPHGNTKSHLHSQYWTPPSYELVKYAYLWTVRLCWSARRGPTQRQGQYVISTKEG